jgi:hypothetical protein
VGDIDFEVISEAENSSNKFPKTRFWNEKSVEDVDKFTLISVHSILTSVASAVDKLIRSADTVCKLHHATSNVCDRVCLLPTQGKSKIVNG